MVEPVRNRRNNFIVEVSSERELSAIAGGIYSALENIKNKKKMVSDYARRASEIMAEVKGSPEDETKSEKVRNVSFVFLSMPDPTMVSTAIGVTTFLVSRGLHVMERRRHGFLDVFKVYRKINMELYDLID